MGFSQIPEFSARHFFSTLKRRAIGAALLALFTLIAVYHLTMAGSMALEGIYGMLYARLIVAAIYAAAAFIVLIVFWATRTKPLIKEQTADAVVALRDTQIVALVEAAMLGYAMARKSGGRR